MKELLSQKVLQLKPSGIRKFFNVANEIPDVISLGVGEPDFATPLHIREAGIQAMQSGKTFYTANSGLSDLRKEICSYTEQKLGISYRPDCEAMVTVGGSEAMKNGGPDAADMRESYNQRRRYLYHELKRLGLPCFEPEGAFYMFPDIREFGMSSEDFAMDLLNREKVAVVPGSAFGESGEGFIRISYAYSIAELKEALARIERYFKKKREAGT